MEGDEREELFDWDKPAEEKKPDKPVETAPYTFFSSVDTASSSWQIAAEKYMQEYYLNVPASFTYSNFKVVDWKPVVSNAPACTRVVIRCEMADGQHMEFEYKHPTEVAVETQKSQPMSLASVMLPGQSYVTYNSPEVVFRVKGGTPYNLIVTKGPAV